MTPSLEAASVRELAAAAGPNAAWVLEGIARPGRPVTRRGSLVASPIPPKVYVIAGSRARKPVADPSHDAGIAVAPPPYSVHLSRLSVGR